VGTTLSRAGYVDVVQVKKGVMLLSRNSLLYSYEEVV